MELLGLDIGGSGIKGAVVDSKTGKFLSKRHRLPTPKPATPEAVSDTVAAMIDEFGWSGPVGCSFPTVVLDGKCLTSGNLSPKWTGVQADQLFSEHCNGLDFYVGNDADLAGIAEMSLGAGRGKREMVVMLTVGTGIGSGLFYNGVLVPNIEMGRLFHTNGKIIERFASDAARKRKDLKLSEWARRFNVFLEHIVLCFNPNYFILGGGISKKFDRFKDEFTIQTPIEPAHFGNNAGIIGAAMFAYQSLEDK